MKKIKTGKKIVRISSTLWVETDINVPDEVIKKKYAWFPFTHRKARQTVISPKKKH